MNVMNVMNMWKSATFMPYSTESKRRLNVMNVARKFFRPRARRVPNALAEEMAGTMIALNPKPGSEYPRGNSGISPGNLGDQSG